MFVRINFLLNLYNLLIYTLFYSYFYLYEYFLFNFLIGNGFIFYYNKPSKNDLSI